MLWSVFVVLLVALLLGVVGFQAMTGFVQIIVLIALIIVGIQLFSKKPDSGR